MSDLLRSTSLLLKLESLHLRMYFRDQFSHFWTGIFVFKLVFEIVSGVSNLQTYSQTRKVLLDCLR